MLNDLITKLRQYSGIEVIIGLIKGGAEMKLVKQPKNKILRQIVSGLNVDASPTKNKDDWKKVFKYVSPDFEKYELVGGEYSEGIEVGVYEMVQDANFKEMCYSLSHNCDGLAVSLDQMSEFCLRNKLVLSTRSYSTFFLLKNKREEFFGVIRNTCGGVRLTI